MGGPAVGVVLGRGTVEADLGSVWRLLESLGRLAPVGAWADVWLETTRPIGGTYEAEECPFGVEWVSEEVHEGNDEDFPSWPDNAVSSFGLIPSSRILLSAGWNRVVDHRIIGELALHMARTYEGVIDFNGALIPRSVFTTAKRLDGRRMYENVNWDDLAEPTVRFCRTLPGRIVGIPYQTVGGRTWVTHVGDCEFMAAWLRHPDFYMIK